jgi:hypothetical protein
LSATLSDTFLVTLKTQILTAAANFDMELRRDYRQDNCESLLTLLEDDDDDDVMNDGNDNDNVDCRFLSEQESLEYVIELTDEDSWATDPISKLPVLSMGVFEGERAKAKAMARELALLWEIPQDVVPASSPSTITETTSTIIASTSNSNSEHSASADDDVTSTNNTNGRKQKRYNNKKDENRRTRRKSISSNEIDFFF